MFGRFLPKETNFFDFFEQHSSIMIEVTHEFMKLISSDNISAFEHTQTIKHLEHQADDVTHHCIEALHKTFITPVDRDDIHRLISCMDDIIDCVDAAFDCLVIYRIKKITPELLSMVNILSQAVDKVAIIVKGLRNMKNVEFIRTNCVDIHRLEHEADVIVRRAIGRLFDEEQDTRLVIKWKEIYEIIEDAADLCEDVANITEGIILEHN